MSELTLELAGDGRGSALDRVRAKFPTAAIAILVFTGSWPKLGPGKARLAEFVVPDDLRTAHRKG
jgi:phosphohistidine phosphatase